MERMKRGTGPGAAPKTAALKPAGARTKRWPGVFARLTRPDLLSMGTTARVALAAVLAGLLWFGFFWATAAVADPVPAVSSLNQLRR